MFVLSNLAISVDGKIGTADRVFFPLGSRADLRKMLRLRKTADAILIGASTLRPYRKASLSGKGPKQPTNVVLSTRLAGFSPDWSFFRDPRIKRILITTSAAPLARRKLFSRCCEVIV